MKSELTDGIQAIMLANRFIVLKSNPVARSKRVDSSNIFYFPSVPFWSNLTAVTNLQTDLSLVEIYKFVFRCFNLLHF